VLESKGETGVFSVSDTILSVCAEYNDLLKVYVARIVGSGLHISLHLGRICACNCVCRINLKSAKFNERGCDYLLDYIST
jgi:hypothetical protein